MMVDAERKPAKMRCFDCGYRIEKDVKAKSASAFMYCPICTDKGLPGMMLVVELDGEPCNEGYFPKAKGPGERYEPDTYPVRDDNPYMKKFKKEK